MGDQTPEQAPVEQSEVIALLKYGFRNIDLPPLDKDDLRDIADGLSQFARHRLAALSPAQGVREAVAQGMDDLECMVGAIVDPSAWTLGVRGDVIEHPHADAARSKARSILRLLGIEERLAALATPPAGDLVSREELIQTARYAINRWKRVATSEVVRDAAEAMGAFESAALRALPGSPEGEGR